jgi:hypothetical protein
VHFPEHPFSAVCVLPQIECGDAGFGELAGFGRRVNLSVIADFVIDTPRGSETCGPLVLRPK